MREGGGEPGGPDLGAQAMAYLRGRFSALPAGQHLGPRLGGATVLIIGAAPLGLRGTLCLEVVLAAEEWERHAAAAPPSAFAVRDPEVEPDTRVSLRGEQWLEARLRDPEGLWLRQHAVLAQDPDDRGADALRRGADAFRAGLAAQAEALYRALRQGFEEADRALDPLGRAVLLGRALRAAMALPFVARGEPWPPPAFLGRYLELVVPEGPQIRALAARAAGDRRVDLVAWANLRRLLDEMLDAAGYGETPVRRYQTLA
jgi:hypothetical protein